MQVAESVKTCKTCKTCKNLKDNITINNKLSNDMKLTLKDMAAEECKFQRELL